jgi:uncharacterized protein (DUF302 family)
MSRAAPAYGFGTVVSGPVQAAVQRVTTALQEEGFGILCQVDVQATLKAKLGVERGEYVILGACNPPLAHQALDAEPALGLLLPCNVVVYAAEDGTHVEAIDPEVLLGLVGNPALGEIAIDVKSRFQRVIGRLQ